MSGHAPGGTLTLAGKNISRLGLGTMRLTGPGTWGEPADRDQALKLLKLAVYIYGITHIDTADAYGPHTVETLIKDALHPYPENVLIATKVGMIPRPSPRKWVICGRPDYLRSCVEGSLRRLGVERLELCYLHRIDSRVPLADQIGTLRALQNEGKIGHIGLSKIQPEEYRTAAKEAAIAAVQNPLNINDRYDPMQELCRDEGIAYVPYRPLDAGSAAQSNTLATALSWLLQLGPHIAPIPGTSNPRHLAEIVKAVTESGPA